MEKGKCSPKTGAASVHFQVLSAESRKYFQNAIMLSGTAFDYWAMSDDNDYFDIPYKVAEYLGKPTTQSDELVEILQSETPENLMEFTLAMTQPTTRTVKFLFAPCIERKTIDVKFSEHNEIK